MNVRNLYVLAAALIVAACARPQEVRTVASRSQPVVVGLQRSGEALQARMAVQTELLAAHAKALSEQAGRARAHTAVLTRDWRLLGQKEPPEMLTLIRDGDAALLADPLSPVASPAASRPPKGTKVDLSALKGAIEGLSTLSGPKRGNFAELIGFATEVRAELEKVDEEADDPAPTPEPTED